jgi:hypothetical protein
MEASAIRAQQRPLATHTSLPAYLRLFRGQREKAYREQMVARIFNEMILPARRQQKHSYPTGNYFCWTWTARCSPHARRVTKAIFYIRSFSRFVSSTIARTAHVQVGSEAAADFFEPLQLYNQTLLEVI